MLENENSYFFCAMTTGPGEQTLRGGIVVSQGHTQLRRRAHADHVVPGRNCGRGDARQGVRHPVSVLAALQREGAG